MAIIQESDLVQRAQTAAARYTEVLAQIIKNDPAVTVISFNGLTLGADNFSAILFGLVANPHIREIQFGSLILSNFCLRDLMNTISRTQVQKIHFGDTPIGHFAADCIAAGARRSSHLTQVEFGVTCNPPDSKMHTIEAALAENRSGCNGGSAQIEISPAVEAQRPVFHREGR